MHAWRSGKARPAPSGSPTCAHRHPRTCPAEGTPRDPAGTWSSWPVDAAPTGALTMCVSHHAQVSLGGAVVELWLQRAALALRVAPGGPGPGSRRGLGGFAVASQHTATQPEPAGAWSWTCSRCRGQMDAHRVRMSGSGRAPRGDAAVGSLTLQRCELTRGQHQNPTDGLHREGWGAASGTSSAACAAAGVHGAAGGSARRRTPAQLQAGGSQHKVASLAAGGAHKALHRWLRTPRGRGSATRLALIAVQTKAGPDGLPHAHPAQESSAPSP